MECRRSRRSEGGEGDRLQAGTSEGEDEELPTYEVQARLDEQ